MAKVMFQVIDTWSSPYMKEHYERLEKEIKMVMGSIQASFGNEEYICLLERCLNRAALIRYKMHVIFEEHCKRSVYHQPWLY